MLSSDLPSPRLSLASRELLLEVARASITAWLSGRRELPLDVAAFALELQEERATFVTLRIEGDLRGCMGSLTAKHPLVGDVARNARSAAFRDPRFAPLQHPELERISVHVSVLNPPEPICCSSEMELLERIRPGVDGLILCEGEFRSTLLPAVWEYLDDPRVFIRHLKQKAGLPSGYWSETLRVARYTTESFGY